jgi:hypothetical protein
MSDDAILIHDEHGFTQAMRRQLLLLLCEEAHACAAAAGRHVSHTEEADGVTLYVDGVQDSRITYAELAALEAHADASPALADPHALVVCRCGEVVIRCRDAACTLVHAVRLIEVCGTCTQTGGLPVLDLEDADVPPLQLGPMWDGNLEEQRG